MEELAKKIVDAANGAGGSILYTALLEQVNFKERTMLPAAINHGRRTKMFHRSFDKSDGTPKLVIVAGAKPENKPVAEGE